MAEGRSDVDKRRWERLPVAIPVFVRGVDAGGKDFLEFTTVLNISAGGALLATKRYIPKGSNVALEIPSAPLPPLAGPPQFVRKVPARLVRVTHSDRSNLCGLEFTNPLT